jgi:triacylglycerol lipase
MNTIVIVILIILLCSLSAGIYAYYAYYKHTKAKQDPAPIPMMAKKSLYTFDHNATEYSRNNAGFLCDVSNQVYYNEEDCREWAKLNGFNEKFYFIDSNKVDSTSHTQGFVAQNPDVILIAFRGTESSALSDFLSDLQGAIKIQWESLGNVHPGFLTALKAVWDKSFNGVKIFPDLIRNAGKRKIWITGHSLGGALAVLCAAQLTILDKIPIHSVYTFGQPRIGDEQFAENMNEHLGSQIFRIVNNRDLIPRLASYSMGYRQFGREIFYDKFGKRNKPDDEKPQIENMEGALVSIRKTEDIQELVYGGFTQGLGFLRQLESTTDIKDIMYNTTDQIKNHLLTAYLFVLDNSKE